MPQHGDLETNLEVGGWVCLCRCGWRSLPRLHPEDNIPARAAAYAVGLMHHRWWNKHPNVEFVGARRENAN